MAQSVALSPLSQGQQYSVSRREPLSTFMMQWALAWSWIGEPLPGVQTRMSYTAWISVWTLMMRRATAYAYQVALPIPSID